MLTHAFEPCFTTKESGSDTGLDLSVVHDFAELSGGTATIESYVGKGSSITIYLPRPQPLALGSQQPRGLIPGALFDRGSFRSIGHLVIVPCRHLELLTNQGVRSRFG